MIFAFLQNIRTAPQSRLTALQHYRFSYREEYLRSIGPFRDAVLAILASIAKQERDRIGIVDGENQIQYSVTIEVASR